MNYDEMSDVEISEAVGKLRGIKVNRYTDVHENDSLGILLADSGRYMETDYWGNEINYDPCNDPSDGWPIIVESRIVIDWYSDGTATADIHSMGIGHTGDNSLRCAMIVFLKIKAAEND